MKHLMLVVLPLFLSACSLWQQQMVSYHGEDIILVGSKTASVSLPLSSYQLTLVGQQTKPEVNAILANQIKINGFKSDPNSALILWGQLDVDITDADMTFCEGEIWDQYGVKRYRYKAAIGKLELNQSYQFSFQIDNQSWPITNIANQITTAYWPKDVQDKSSYCAKHYNGHQSMPLEWGYYEKASFKHKQLLQQYLDFLQQQANVIVYTVNQGWLSEELSANKLEAQVMSNYQQWLSEQRQQLFLNSNASIIGPLNSVLDQQFGYGHYPQSFASYEYHQQAQLNQGVKLLQQGKLAASLEILLPQCVRGQYLYQAMACYHLAMVQLQLGQSAAAKTSIQQAVTYVEANQSEIIDLFSGSFNQQALALAYFINRYQPIFANADTAYQSVD
ncbi:hypothetical protein [Paraferrimonas sp. SM1919]|uniref:hypothetical protein n=1 Tax=Paraferrimonas sp. SM1919 TaxID=2662263 RepID=UPI0013D19050|nr:hypothetical protein [Paraferrimonas sp. SM1919]